MLHQDLLTLLMKLTMLGYINKLLLLTPLVVFSNFQDSIQMIDLDNVIVKSTKINSSIQQAPQLGTRPPGMLTNSTLLQRYRQ